MDAAGSAALGPPGAGGTSVAPGSHTPADFDAFIGFVPIEDDTVITVTSNATTGGELERAQIGP